MHKGAPTKPGSAFDLYCDETRSSLKEKLKEGDDVEDELSSRWKDLPDSQRDVYQSRAEQQLAEYEKEKEAYDAKAAKDAAGSKADGDDDKADKADSTEPDRPSAAAAAAEEDGTSRAPQEDVEMTNYDTDQETQGEKPEE